MLLQKRFIGVVIKFIKSDLLIFPVIPDEFPPSLRDDKC